MGLKKIAIAIIVLLMISGCVTAAPMTELKLLTEDYSQYGDYHLKILIIKNSSDTYLEIYQHLQSTNHANVTIKTVDFDKLKDLNDINEFDLIYPDYSILNDENFSKDSFTEAIINYVSQGGNIVLEHAFYEIFPKELLGVEEFIKVENTNYEFSYPNVGDTYQEVQQIYDKFLVDAKKAKFYNDEIFRLDVGAKVSSATSLVNADGLSVALKNTYQQGNILWFNKVMLNRTEYITRLDFQKILDTQSHFHFGFNSLSWLLRNKLLNIVAINKYGYALEKVMGPYTRPGLSWQNHFEEYNGFKYKDMIRFTELAKEYNQIPSYSLVRGTYRWGKWKNSISVNLNKGTKKHSLFTGYTPNSFYGTGERITYTDETNIDLGWHPTYKTLMSEIELPTRGYISIGDMTGDKKDDLIVGNHLGYIYCLPNISKTNTPKFDSKITLKANGYKINLPFASPTVADLNGDGKLDMVVGDKDGYLTTYINSYKYNFYKSNRVNLKIGKYLSPSLTDFNSDGIIDLIVGNDTGEVYLMKGYYKGKAIKFMEPNLLLSTDLKWVAPFAYDYNSDGNVDILLGSYKGQVAIYLNEVNGFIFGNVVQGHNKTMYGNKNINFGHNSVPIIYDWNKDGSNDLVIGGLEYGAPYAIDNPNLPIRDYVLANLEYAKENFLEIDLHIYEHSYKTSEEEREEYQLHFDAMKSFGLETENVGINHHTWTTNVDTLTNLQNQMDFGAFYNFGFRPFGSIGSPRDSKSFAPAIVPFMLMDEEDKDDYIYWCPAPSTYTKSMEGMLQFDLPLTFFEHVECRLNKGTKYYNSLVATIERVANYHQQGDYNFMTERQIAKSLMNMYNSNVSVAKLENGITIEPLNSNVPESAAEYKNTLGIKFIPGPELINSITSNAIVQTSSDKNSNLYIGVDKPIAINWSAEGINNNSLFTILKTNVPTNINYLADNSIELNLNSVGMQQLTLKATSPLKIDGKGFYIEKDDDSTYTLTHYGDVCSVVISKKE